MQGMVMDIQKFCLHDGPGIRTCIFLKGCNMQCIWCHNPESMDRKPTLMYVEERCSGCMRCKEVCEFGVHQIEENRHKIDRSKCANCGKCVALCPSSALQINGTSMDSEEVMEEIRKDEKYYLSSGGGVTISGGEATLQYDFLIELLTKCKQAGYQTALETNGLISEERIKELSSLTDIFLLDYKATGSIHKELTGVPIGGVLDTIARLDDLGSCVYLRCPLVPGVNDTEEHFAAIRKLKINNTCIKEVEIMAYHDIGRGKWQECGKEYTLHHIKTASVEQKSHWEECLKSKRSQNE